MKMKINIFTFYCLLMVLIIGIVAFFSCSIPQSSDSRKKTNQDNGKKSQQVKIQNQGRSFGTMNLVCDGTDKGLDLPGINPQDLKSNFRIELEFVAGATQNTYADILDFNHRDNVGLVIQQAGTSTNTFVFYIGNGSSYSYVTYHFNPGTTYSIVFQKVANRLQLFVSEGSYIGSFRTLPLEKVAETVCFSGDVYFLPGTVPTLGYNKNYSGRGFNGQILNVKFWQGNYGNYNNPVIVCNGLPGCGINLGSGFSSKMKDDFIIDMMVNPAGTQNAYANIIDVNHRDNVGIVIQQVDTHSNIFMFYWAGQGVDCNLAANTWQHVVQFKAGKIYGELVNNAGSAWESNEEKQTYIYDNSDVTVGYNKNYGRYFNGSIKDVVIWTGLSTSAVPPVTLLPVEGDFTCSPVLNNNVIYAGIWTNNQLVAMDTTTGNKLWGFTSSSAFTSSPVIGYDGVIYAGDENGTFYAINPNGTEKWRKTIADFTGFGSEIVIGSDGTIYLPAQCKNYQNSKLYALNPANGEEKWSVPPSPSFGYIDYNMAIGNNDTLYVSNSNGITAFTNTGRYLWKMINYSLAASPVVGQDGTIYYGDSMGFIYAINIDGSLKWKCQIGHPDHIVIGKDGTLYVASSLGQALYAITTNGNLKWTFNTSSNMDTSPVIARDGTIFAASYDGYLYAIYPDGTKKAVYETYYKSIKFNPILDEKGTIYTAGSYKLNPYAYNIMKIMTGCGGLADSAWPKYKKNLQNNK
jgi:outer membrane protein assembly factor BamB